MKDEFKGKIISEFVGLKSKIYSLIAEDGEEVKKAKGFNRTVVKNMRHEKYINVLLNKRMVRHKMKIIRSDSYGVCKISLSCFDDKRYILGNEINSLAYFHKDRRIQ